jgi:hypothetical protein
MALWRLHLTRRDFGGKSRCTSHCWAVTSLDFEVFGAWESTSHRLGRQRDHGTVRIQLEACCLRAQPHGSPTSSSPLRRLPCPSLLCPPLPLRGLVFENKRSSCSRVCPTLPPSGPSPTTQPLRKTGTSRSTPLSSSEGTTADRARKPSRI